MKKNIVFLLSFLLLCVSCNNKNNKQQSAQSSQHNIVTNQQNVFPVEIMQESNGVNEKVQDTFFGTKFGDDITILYKIADKMNLRIYQQTKDCVGYSCDRRSPIDFGGFTWDFMLIYNTEGKFSMIQFFKRFDEKEIASREYKNVFNAISNKYNLKNNSNNDEWVYNSNSFIGMNNVTGILEFKTTLDITNEQFYAVNLAYICTGYWKNSSDEL